MIAGPNSKQEDLTFTWGVVYIFERSMKIQIKFDKPQAIKKNDIVKITLTDFKGLTRVEEADDANVHTLKALVQKIPEATK